MARYIGTIKGRGGEVSRLGQKTSGLEVTANAWDVGVLVILRYNEQTDKDEISVYKTGGSNGGNHELIAEYIV